MSAPDHRMTTPRAGQRYYRAGDDVVADVLAVVEGRVLLVARWPWQRQTRLFNSCNCLWLGLDDFCRRYVDEATWRSLLAARHAA